MFGEVPGVPVGTVFGAGDYQRKGRTEMMETGFFRPWVTPEWFDPNRPVRLMSLVGLTLTAPPNMRAGSQRGHFSLLYCAAHAALDPQCAGQMHD